MSEFEGGFFCFFLALSVADVTNHQEINTEGSVESLLFNKHYLHRLYNIMYTNWRCRCPHMHCAPIQCSTPPHLIVLVWRETREVNHQSETSRTRSIKQMEREVNNQNISLKRHKEAAVCFKSSSAPWWQQRKASETLLIILDDFMAVLWEFD